MTDDLGIVWFRRDLRLDDNPAWAAATSEHSRVLALFVVDPVLLDRAGERRAARLLGDVAALDRRLVEHGGRLCVRVGDPTVVVAAEAAPAGRGRGPCQRRRDPVRDPSRRRGRRARSPPPASVGGPSWGTVVHRPGHGADRGGHPVAGLHAVPPGVGPHPVGRRGPSPETGRPLDDAGDPHARGARGPTRSSTGRRARPPSRGRSGPGPGWTQAADRADRYDDEHDRPDLVGTSLLSADLRFGTLSPRTVVDVVGRVAARVARRSSASWRGGTGTPISSSPRRRWSTGP